MKTKLKNKRLLKIMVCMCLTIMTLTVAVSASGSSGSTTATASSAVSAIQTILTGIMGYISGVTSEMLGNQAWLLGMGFFVLLFIAGFVSYWFRIGRR